MGSSSAIESETTTTEETETDEDGAEVTTITTTTIKKKTPGTPPAEGTPPVAAPTPTDELLAQRTARVPASLMPTKGKPKQEAETIGYRTLLAMLAKAAPSHSHGSWDLGAIERIRNDKRIVGTLYAELADIVLDGDGAPNDMIVPQWLGELWFGRQYQARWKPLLGSGVLNSPSLKGWRWKTGPEVDEWEGNKTDVPTNEVETEPYDVEAQPFAWAADVDRRYKDFNVTEFWDGLFKAMTESYAKKSDLYVPKQLFDPANAALTPVVRSTVPTGVNPVMASIVDGALAMIDEDLPSWAAVSVADFRSLALTREQDKLAFLNTALGLEEGTVEAFRVIPTTHAGLNGGKVLVGAKSAATVHELPGSPVRIEGLDIARGGIDPGLYGYEAVVVHNPKALVRVSPPA